MPTILIKKTGEEPGAASLAVTVPVEQVQQAEARATSAYQRRAPLPGVRKGKAPPAPLEKEIAEDNRPQTLEELICGKWEGGPGEGAVEAGGGPHNPKLERERG